METQHRYQIIDRLDNLTVTEVRHIVTKSSEYMLLSNRFVENEKTTGGLEFAVGIEDALSTREKPVSRSGLFLV